MKLTDLPHYQPKERPPRTIPAIVERDKDAPERISGKLREIKNCGRTVRHWNDPADRWLQCSTPGQAHKLHEAFEHNKSASLTVVGRTIIGVEIE